MISDRYRIGLLSIDRNIIYSATSTLVKLSRYLTPFLDVAIPFIAISLDLVGLIKYLGRLILREIYVVQIDWVHWLTNVMFTSNNFQDK